MATGKCVKTISGQGFIMYPCGKPVVEGSNMCKRHDPASVQAAKDQAVANAKEATANVPPGVSASSTLTHRVLLLWGQGQGPIILPRYSNTPVSVISLLLVEQDTDPSGSSSISVRGLRTKKDGSIGSQEYRANVYRREDVLPAHIVALLDEAMLAQRQSVSLSQST